MSLLGWSGDEIRKIFHGDGLLLDNYLFKIHHQLNFFVVLFGALFVTGMNYLHDDAIKCTGAGDKDFAQQYCWLHGSGHVINDLASKLSKGDCYSGEEEKDENYTHYYLWIPFVLGICLIVIKAPRVLWNEVFERGLVKGFVQIANEEKAEPGKKMKERFRKLKARARDYGASYLLCEVLNIVSVMTCFCIVDSLLGGKFWSYGKSHLQYDMNETEIAIGEGKMKKSVNPLCAVFPTEVSCNVYTGGSTGGVDTTNMLCILSNNLFNQYYFLILWWWWVILIIVSCLGFVYRLAQVIIPGVSKQILIAKVLPLGQADKARQLRKFNQWDFFLLGRICQNLKGSQIDAFLGELVPEKKEKEEKNDGVEMKKLAYDRLVET